MTLTLNLTNITDAISQLSVTGVTFKDYDGVASNWQSTPNVFYPNPENFITGFEIRYPAIQQGGDSPVDVMYTLNYRLLGTAVGNLGNFSEAYADIVEKAAAVLAKIIETDSPYSGTVEMKAHGFSIGARTDPAGNSYHGADIAVSIVEQH